MPLQAGTKTRLQNERQYLGGQISMRHQEALFKDLEEKAGAGQSKPNIKVVTVTNAISTAQTAVATAGTLYRGRVQNTSASEVIVIVSDAGNNIIVAATRCPATGTTGPGGATVAGCAEFDVNGGADGVGIPFLTDLRVRAFLASDGTTTAASGVTVKLQYG